MSTGKFSPNGEAVFYIHKEQDKRRREQDLLAGEMTGEMTGDKNLLF